LYVTCEDETTVLNAIVTQSRYEENLHIYSIHNVTCRPSSFLVLWSGLLQIFTLLPYKVSILY